MQSAVAVAERTHEERIQDAVDTLKEREVTDLDRALTFTLADAIREGSTVTGQAVNCYVDPYGNACAMAAAWVSLRARGVV